MVFCFPLPYFPLSTSALFFAKYSCTHIVYRRSLVTFYLVKMQNKRTSPKPYSSKIHKMSVCFVISKSKNIPHLLLSHRMRYRVMIKLIAMKFGKNICHDMRKPSQCRFAGMEAKAKRYFLHFT